ncbi:MAG: hypothetical protein ACOH5I_12530 [Oligoflexus sp.]
MKPSKYLQRQCEPEGSIILQALQNASLGPWDYFIGIPLCGEHERYQTVLQSVARLEKLSAHERILLVLLVNEHPDTPADYIDANQKTLVELSQGSSRSLSTAPPTWLDQSSPHKFDTIVVNRTQAWRFPAKQGVGLARKIIADIGLCLYRGGLLRRRWLHNTDGDVSLPGDYLLQAENWHRDQTSKALLYQYQHVQDQSGSTADSHWQAAKQYEIWLRYYELGLAYAGSPYAFPTIGSTITFAADAYESVHGFPRRSAGEDFYLLNKLAKLGKIQVLGGRPIVLTDRPSIRVPFGTGQGTAKIENLMRKNEDFQVYHPVVFDGLKLVLEAAIQSLAHQDPEAAFPTILQESAQQICPTLCNEKNAAAWEQAISSFGFAKACATAAKQARDTKGIRQQFHVWFDAFRTLKWIHLLRDQFFGSIHLLAALDEASFIPQEDIAGERLQQLRHIQSVHRSGGLY